MMPRLFSCPFSLNGYTGPTRVKITGLQGHGLDYLKNWSILEPYGLYLCPLSKLNHVKVYQNKAILVRKG